MGGVGRKAVRGANSLGRGMGLLDADGQSTIMKKLDPNDSLAMRPSGAPTNKGPRTAIGQTVRYFDQKKDPIGIVAQEGADLRAPDFTDEQIQNVKRAQQLQLRTGRTRQGSFRTGGLLSGGGR